MRATPNALTSLLRSVGPVFDREVRARIRTPWPYIEALADPVFLLVLLGPLVAGLATTPGIPEGDTTQWFVPGILVLLTLYAGLQLGATIQEERTAGSLERMLVTPVSRSALLLGRVLRPAVTVVVMALVVIAATLPFGLSVTPLELVISLLVLALLAAGLATASLALGLLVRDYAGFGGVMTLALLPLMVTSGAFLPMELAPDWLYAISRANPLAHAVDAQRALFANELDPSIALTVLISGALGALGGAAGVHAMKRIRL